MSARERVFPSPWQKQRLALIPKVNKPSDDPSSYCSIWLMDTSGNVFENIICGQLEQYIEGCQGLSASLISVRLGLMLSKK